MTDTVDRAKQAVNQGKERLLKTFSFVPEDKLSWSPSPSAKSALRIVAHCGVTNHFFASMLQGEKLRVSSLAEAFSFVDAEEKKIASRDQAVKRIEDSSQLVLAALDALTPEKIAGNAETPFGPRPMSFFMHIPGLHMQNHASQVDYLQTIWGDMELHM